MPNWCWNEELICGPRQQIRDLHEKLVTWLATKDEHGYDGWLGYIGIGAGMSIDYKDDLPGSKIPYFYPRGQLVEIPEMGELDQERSVIRFASETAWGSGYDGWDRLLNIHAPGCRYYFVSIEPGNDVYLRRDPEYMLRDEDYYLNSYVGDEDACPEDLNGLETDDPFWYSEDVLPLLQKLLNSTSDKIDDLVTEFNEHDWGEDNYFSFHRIEDIV